MLFCSTFSAKYGHFQSFEASDLSNWWPWIGKPNADVSARFAENRLGMPHIYIKARVAIVVKQLTRSNCILLY